MDDNFMNDLMGQFEDPQPDQPNGNPTTTTTEDPATPPAQPGALPNDPKSQEDPGKSTQNPDQQTPPLPDDKGNNPMRTLRKQYDDIKKERDVFRQDFEKQKALLEKLAARQGIPIEQLETKLQEEADKKLAQERQLPEEVVKQMREQNERIVQLERENERADFNVRANSLMREMQIDQNQFLDFANNAKQAGFNILQRGLDLNVLYRAMNYDTLVDKVKTQAKQDVLAEIQRTKNKSPQPNTYRPIANPTGSQNPAVDDLQFINDIFGSFKR